MRRPSVLIAALLLLCAPLALGQLTLPPDGENQGASVTQHIGLVRVTIDYHSPDVHAPNGEDRRGKIWGGLVPYGTPNLGFGTCAECPWRAGANENTAFTVSHDVKVEGQPLPAGSYGLHMIPGPDEWTLIFSKNAASWGSFFYDPAEDALRVKVKPVKGAYHEWLTYEFTERLPERARVAMRWEDLEVPWTISVDDMPDLYLAKIGDELRGNKGFDWANWNAAAQWALQNKRNAEALRFAEAAVGARFVGQENFRSLSTLAAAQEAAGKTAEATVTRKKALDHPTASTLDLHQYGRQLLAAGKKEEALEVFQLNAKRHGTEWPVHVGLARGYSAVGRMKDAIRYTKLAIAQAPDDLNRNALQDGLKKLEAGKDMNQ